MRPLFVAAVAAVSAAAGLFTAALLAAAGPTAPAPAPGELAGHWLTFHDDSSLGPCIECSCGLWVLDPAPTSDRGGAGAAARYARHLDLAGAR